MRACQTSFHVPHEEWSYYTIQQKLQCEISSPTQTTVCTLFLDTRPYPTYPKTILNPLSTQISLQLTFSSPKSALLQTSCTTSHARIILFIPCRLSVPPNAATANTLSSSVIASQAATNSGHNSADIGPSWHCSASLTTLEHAWRERWACFWMHG
jgi:hypothetical protein